MNPYVFDRNRNRDRDLGTAAAGTRCVVKRAFPAWSYQGVQVVQGEIVTLAGAMNDDRLVQGRYLEPLAKDAKTGTCASCRREFRADLLTVHKSTHKAVPTAPKDAA